MFKAVGKVIVAESNTPLITPTTINPFILVTEPVKITLLNPDKGSDKVNVGSVKTCTSSLKY